MSPRLRRSAPAAALLLLGASLSTVATAPSSAAPADVDAVTMSVSPKVYTGGQLITYSGNVGAAGVKVVLQGSQRPGAPWSKQARTTSDANGDYSIRMPAPSMRGIMRRVVAGGVAGDAMRMYAQSQDVVMVPVGRPVVGQEFDVVVSTVPGPHWPRGHSFFVKGRPDLPAPVFEGRQVTLEQRDADGTWSDVAGASATVDADGEARMTITATAAGTVVYRAVQEDFPQAGHDPIGWFPSFPTEVRVAASAASATNYGEPGVNRVSAGRTAAADTTDGYTASRTTASGVTAQQRYTWGGAKWDFGLPLGQSITSPPSRGKSLVGWWDDGSTGGGRANQHNGGVALNSQRYAPDRDEPENAGDHGDTWITLQDQAQKFGRWETRVRLRPYESRAQDYRTVVELVPDALSGDSCTDRIVIADMAAHSKKLRIGAQSVSKGRQWNANRFVGDVRNRNIAVAVEVGRRHVTWFVDGKPIGSVRSRAIVPRVPLTLKITLKGDGDTEMNRTLAHMDWMRGFTLDRGKQVKRSSRVRARGYGGC